MLGEGLIFSEMKHSVKPAIIYKEENYSYSQLYKCAKNLASSLIRNNIKKGDRIAVYMNNSWQCAISIYGITLAGGTFLVINPQTKANKLAYILNDSGSKILISESSCLSELKKSINEIQDLPIFIISDDNPSDFLNQNYLVFSEQTEPYGEDISLPVVIPNDLAALIYTSGSTGFPKGVMMTHQAMVFTTWSLLEYLRMKEDEKIMLVLPLAFDYGLYQLLMAISIGGTLIIEHSFNFPPTIFRQIERHQPTVFPGVPSIFAIMIATYKKSGLKFESIKKITNTAAALPEEFTADLRKIFPNALIFKMYGLTECKRVCYLEPELVDTKKNSVGKAIPGTEVFLLSEDGIPVKPGEQGILHVRGPHVMAGYWNNKELTDKMLKPGLIPGEKILCAHDLFKMDEDGFLYFMGRNDDIIKTRGEKVSPIEVENAIYKYKSIKEAAVIGIPDNILGEAIIAYVTTYNNIPVGEKDIQIHCNTILESFMIPKRIIYMKEMPKSSNGKINKLELKKLPID